VRAGRGAGQQGGEAASSACRRLEEGEGWGRVLWAVPVHPYIGSSHRYIFCVGTASRTRVPEAENQMEMGRVECVQMGKAAPGLGGVVAVSKGSREEGLGLPLHRGEVQPPACMPCCSSVPSVPSTNVSSSAVTATVSTRFHVPTRCQSGAHGSLWETSAQPSGICFSSPFLFSLTADNCKYSVCFP